MDFRLPHRSALRIGIALALVCLVVAFVVVVVRNDKVPARISLEKTLTLHPWIAGPGVTVAPHAVLTVITTRKLGDIQSVALNAITPPSLKAAQHSAHGEWDIMTAEANFSTFARMERRASGIEFLLPHGGALAELLSPVDADGTFAFTNDGLIYRIDPFSLSDSAATANATMAATSPSNEIRAPVRNTFYTSIGPSAASALARRAPWRIVQSAMVKPVPPFEITTTTAPEGKTTVSLRQRVTLQPNTHILITLIDDTNVLHGVFEAKTVESVAFQNVASGRSTPTASSEAAPRIQQRGAASDGALSTPVTIATASAPTQFATSCANSDSLTGMPTSGQVKLTLNGDCTIKDTTNAGTGCGAHGGVLSNKVELTGEVTIEGNAAVPPECKIELTATGDTSVRIPDTELCKPGTGRCTFVVRRAFTPGTPSCGSVQAKAVSCCVAAHTQTVDVQSYGVSFNPSFKEMREGPRKDMKDNDVKVTAFPASLRIDSMTTKIEDGQYPYRNLLGPTVDTKMVQGGNPAIFRIMKTWWTGLEISRPLKDLSFKDRNPYLVSARVTFNQCELPYNSHDDKVYFQAIPYQAISASSPAPRKEGNDIQQSPFGYAVARIQPEALKKFVASNLRTESAGPKQWCTTMKQAPLPDWSCRAVTTADPKIDQYHSKVEQEMTRHCEQTSTTLSWVDAGGLRESWSWDRIALSTPKWCAANRGLSRAQAFNAVYQALVTRAYEIIKNTSDGTPGRCYREWTAKRSVGLVEPQPAGLHYQATYVGCPDFHKEPPPPAP